MTYLVFGVRVGIIILSILTVATLMIVDADALTKDEAASQYAQREQAKIKQNDTGVQHPDTKLNVISLDISRTCKLIKSAKCPTINNLIPYDTTNQKYIGKFVDNHRAKSPLKYPSVFYLKANDTIICVACPYDIYIHSKQITVDMPFIYKNNADRTMINNTRDEYHNRYVDNCAYARVAWMPELNVNCTIINLLDDTIQYLKSSCTQTGYNEKVTIQTKPTKHDISTSQAYKTQKWFEEAKKLKTENCIKSTKC